MPVRHFIPGTHYAIPSAPCRVEDSTTWEVRFHKSLLYWHNDPALDKDWNKALGFKERYFSPRYRACMLGFRPAQNRSTAMEITPYWNIDNKNFYPIVDGEAVPLLVLPFVNDWTAPLYCKIWINSPIFTWFIYDSDKKFIANYQMDLATDKTKFWEINPYYGGQARAKAGMKLFLEKIASFE